MIVPFVLFLILLVWGLTDGELYAKEGTIYLVIVAICLAGLFLVPGFGLYFVVPACLVDIILLIKLVGNPSVT